jgi:hypothetical protein
MNWMAFIASLTGSLAWPVAVLAIFFLLRKHIAALLPLLRELKYKDVQLTFGERVRELAAEVVDVLPEPAETPALGEGELSHLERLGRLSPRAAILEAWIPVEQAALKLAVARGITLTRDARVAARGVAEALARAGAISEEEAMLFNALRRLRNEAAHAVEFTTPRDSVAEYIELSQRLAAALQQRQVAT